ncbi:hypothetical protein ACMXYO_09325 [Neptuniibacter sp. QD37_6]|uniref:hypothetical protein n=1 Tax=Neptuniibacter sp. QD37_6 TaxID=3398210 RepID=UPI0039F603B1
MMIRTPKTKFRYFLVLTSLFCIQSVCTFLHNVIVLQSIKGPPNAPDQSFVDIAQMIFQDAIKEQAFFFMLLGILLLPSLIRHSGNISLLKWQRNHPVRSAVWSLVFTAIALLFLLDAVNIYLSSQISIENLVGSISIVGICILARAESV